MTHTRGRVNDLTLGHDTHHPYTFLSTIAACLDTPVPVDCLTSSPSSPSLYLIIDDNTTRPPPLPPIPLRARSQRRRRRTCSAMGSTDLLRLPQEETEVLDDKQGNILLAMISQLVSAWCEDCRSPGIFCYPRETSC